MNDLVIGDIHATPDELDDVAKLFDLIEKSEHDYKPDRIVFLGDLHHTFSIVNVKVISFYRERLRKLHSPVVAIPGNHDMPGTGQRYPHALLAYEDLVDVYDEPTYNFETYFIPYVADPNLFHEMVAKAPKQTKVIYCHQEFNGAEYDNGFFAPGGADPAKMPCMVVSGHIHTPQTLGKVWYPGSPRWRTLSDANIDRAIHVLGETGYTPITTVGVCKRIIYEKYIEGENEYEPRPFSEGQDFRFHVEGSPEYVNRTLEQLQVYPDARISTVIKNKTVRVRESDGIDVAFRKYAGDFKAKNGTPPEVLAQRGIQSVYGEQRV